ncbi:unnamed protein product [Meganyctiphanes norvegica]|uniref:Beta/gamma crystallin 'Greek key' domain-containing protein n=1 Tax=Meganyctiphanes norvegica TaxID=48144 RepID=A0AAV2RPF7_MEGNR
MFLLLHICYALVGCAAAGFGGDQSHNITLYSEADNTGEQITFTSFSHDLSLDGFNDKTHSMCGVGAWILYKNEDYQYDENSWTTLFTAGQYKCYTLGASRAQQASSLRYVGSGDLDDQVLTIYYDYAWSGGEMTVIRDQDDLGGYGNHGASFTITGNGSWTVYSGVYFTGESLCVKPTADPMSGKFFGAWDVRNLQLPADMISSIRKGCFSNRVVSYSG